MEDVQNVEVVEEKVEEASKVTFSKEQQEHINKLISQQRSKAVEDYQKKQEQEKSEAKKLAKMNDAEKHQHELDKINAEKKELADRLARFEMEKVATKILNDSEIAVSDDVLNFVIRDTAEHTEQSINSFIGLVNSLADKKVDSMLKGKSPKRVESSTNGMTKSQIMAISDRNERQRLISENIELFTN